MKEKVKVELSTLSVAKFFIVAMAIYFLFLIKDIIALLFVVFILAASLRPVVKNWERRTNRLTAVLLIFALIILLFSAIFYLIIPPVVSQIRSLINAYPEYVEKYGFLQNLIPSAKDGAANISPDFGKITGGVINFTAGVLGGFITTISAMIMTIYLLLDENNSIGFLINLVPEHQQASVRNLSTKVSQKVGDWFRGQIILCLIIGVIVGFGLWVLGVPYALTLGVLAAVLEIIPTIGPIIAGGVAALIALQVSPLSSLLVVIFFIIINQLENSFLVPKIMQKAVGLSPIIVILAVLMGAKLLGVLGAVLAVPIAASIWVFIQEWPTIRNALKEDVK